MCILLRSSENIHVYTLSVSKAEKKYVHFWGVFVLLISSSTQGIMYLAKCREKGRQVYIQVTDAATDSLQAIHTYWDLQEGIKKHSLLPPPFSLSSLFHLVVPTLPPSLPPSLFPLLLSPYPRMRSTQLPSPPPPPSPALPAGHQLPQRQQTELWLLPGAETSQPLPPLATESQREELSAQNPRGMSTGLQYTAQPGVDCLPGMGEWNRDCITGDT